MALRKEHLALGAVAAFVAWGYAIHWVPVIRWIGYSFVSGVVLVSLVYVALAFLTSRGSVGQLYSRSPRPRGAMILDPKVWETYMRSRSSQEYEPQPLCAESPRIAQFVSQLLDLVLRDFVKTWYSHISKDPCFPNEVDRAIRLALTDLLDRLGGVDLAEVITARLVPIFTAHFRDFYAAEIAVRGRKLNRSVTESEELDLAIASKFREGKLHPAASLSFPDTKLIQQDYLRNVVQNTILPGVLSHSFLYSRAVSGLVREIVSCAVLSPVMQALSEPDTWNQIMENFGRTMLQDRSTVRKLRAALDQHASPSPKASKAISFPRLSPGDSERKFEKFIRATRKTNNLSDARRFRSEVSSQLKRDSLEDNQDQVYLRRLEMGKRILDQRVYQLAAGGNRRSPVQAPPLPTSTSNTAGLENASLVEILKDASALSYFMEYMDRQDRMSLVQFWLVVDGFRNPLEDDGQDDDPSTTTLAMWSNSDRNDLQQIDQAYLSRPELRIPNPGKQDLQNFLAAGKSATPLQYHRARRAILAAQTAVLEEINSKHFQSFKKSDLFYKCLASQEASTSQSLQTSEPPTINAIAPPGPSVPRPQSTRPTPRPVSRLAQRQGASEGKRSNSTSDLRGLSPSVNGLDPRMGPRRSLDEDSSNPLFDEEDGNDDMIDSVQSLDQDAGLAAPDTQVVQAVEQALNNIMEDQRPQTAEDFRASLFGNEERPDSLFSGDGDSHKEPAERERPQHTKEAEKPSLQSLGLVSASSRIGVFVDDDLFADEDAYLPDEHDGIDDEPADSGEDEVHEAAPGDLGLAEAITVLTNDINKLAAQEAVVESLTKKAELTNNMAELRILRKSKASLQREIRRKELQRQQYIVQESDNSLHGRSTVRIKSIRVGKEDDGREFALYVVEVQRNAGEQMPAAAWSVARRYSEFHELHQKLRSMYPSVRSLDFPRRRMVMKFQSEFLRKRRIALENYLRELLLLPEVCRSRELRAFLSQSVIAQGQDVVDREGKRDMITRLYDSVADGVEDILGNIPVLDQLSVAGQNLIAAATNQLNAMPVGDSEEGISAAEAEAELNAFETFENKELEPFIKPICDIFLEVFELNRGNNWLRGRAVVVVLQQLLGGTIERKVRENVKVLAQEDAVLRYLGLLKDNLWPGGEFARNKRARTAQEKKKSRTEASLMLAILVPDLAGGVVGRANAQAASRRIFATFNNARLNSHLAFTLLDEVVSIIFATPTGTESAR
ncbi:related to intermediate filament protein MDM1 [Cephalotrichum gorgonifer]|uniref:Related to intermediate filament protein MDM1 n=1 Tax=Cephalotrichum gorgonifer TaxID=2041049 RepID=A0AAE8SW61_9PEZI|nr:related to intermediate filament protein MDM1 [Cephalotrichum gorgonifer]